VAKNQKPVQGYARIRVKGRISEVDFREMPDGKKLCRVTLVVNDLKNQKMAEWFVAVCWEEVAVNAQKYLFKGGEVEFYGYPHLNKWRNHGELQIKVMEMHLITRLKKPESYDPDEKF